MKLKPKQKPNPLILGLGTDANDEQSRLINKVDVDNFFGEEQKELMSRMQESLLKSSELIQKYFYAAAVASK